jgi:hypothetical protein
MSNIIGTCAKCGYALDVLLIGRCPNCRLQAVAKAFAPVDAIRTALGIPGLIEDAELDGVYHWHDGMNSGDFYRRMQQAEAEETPRECKIPQDKATQIYELKRRFRL